MGPASTLAWGVIFSQNCHKSEQEPGLISLISFSTIYRKRRGLNITSKVRKSRLFLCQPLRKKQKRGEVHSMYLIRRPPIYHCMAHVYEAADRSLEDDLLGMSVRACLCAVLCTSYTEAEFLNEIHRGGRSTNR
jgi:hypothetical protein